MLLTDKEILAGVNSGGLAEGGELMSLTDAGRKEYLGVAKAQLKKVVEWLFEPCPHYSDSDVTRGLCGICRQALQKEVQ